METNTVAHIIELIGSLKGDSDAPLGLHEPHFDGNEWAYIKDCLDTRWVSSVGAYVDRFERMLADLTGAAYAIACVNGTSALMVSLNRSF